MAITFGQVEAVLALVNDIADDHRSKLRARLQSWQKLKFPEGLNTGRGVKAQYRLGQLFQLVVMLELLKRGLTPERAISLTNRHWETLSVAIHSCLSRLERERCPAEAIGIIYVDGLMDLKDPLASIDTILTVLYYPDIAAIYAGELENLSPVWRKAMSVRGFTETAIIPYFRAIMEQGIHLNLLQISERTVWALTSLGVSLREFEDELHAWTGFARAYHEHSSDSKYAGSTKTPLRSNGWPEEMERQARWREEARGQVREALRSVETML